MTELDYSINPNSRFQVYPSPVASPGKCGVCGAVDRPVVDFNMTIQFYGAVYICVLCFNEAAQSMNLVPKSDLIEAQNSLTQSFELTLAQKDLVAIPRVEFAGLIVGLSTILADVSNSAIGTTLLAQVGKEAAASLFDFNDESVISDTGTIKQSNDFTISERPVEFSGSSVDGSTEFNL